MAKRKGPPHTPFHGTADAEAIRKRDGVYTDENVGAALAAAREEGRRAADAALKAADEALDSLWAAVGDRLLGKGPLSREYANKVGQEIREAQVQVRALARGGSK